MDDRQNKSNLPRRTLLKMDKAPLSRPAASWAIFLIGFLLWITVQGFLTAVPLWTRALPPETDDSLSYVLKSREMLECPDRDCPALKDLKMQLSERYSDEKSYPVRRLASSRIFPFYHPLFSVLMVGLHKLGLGWMAAYKLIWTAGPLIFGLAFACFLAALWGLPSAGLALGLLAFKVFPDTGLHCVVPSNLTMAIAVFTWARIISKKGNAPFTLAVGALLMVSMHPVGLIYTAMALVIAVFMHESLRSPRAWLPVIEVALPVALLFGLSAAMNEHGLPNIHIIPKGTAPFLQMLKGAAGTLTEVTASIVRLEAGLLGSIPVFFGAAALGFAATPPEKRVPAIKITGIYLFFLFAVSFYVSTHHGDLFLRIWIPLVVILFGAVGRAVLLCLERCWDLAIKRIKEPHADTVLRLNNFWPWIILALLAGYSMQMSVRGAEQVYALTEHMRKRQPLMLAQSQTRLLLARAKPGDRVLYTSIIIMPYYFIHGAMDLGAVYYHPLMKGTRTANKWLNRPDLRFAVTYNPTVYHPSFEGRKENNWWIQRPGFHFSPLERRRKHGPISREGRIPARLFKWIEIAPETTQFPGCLRIHVENPVNFSKIEVVPLISGSDQRGHRDGMVLSIPPGWTGWVELKLKDSAPSRRFRILMPGNRPRFMIGGILFGESRLHWPWEQRAKMDFMLRDGDAGLVSLSFDPARILPPPLNEKEITVMDDTGSSVLFRISEKD